MQEPKAAPCAAPSRTRRLLAEWIPLVVTVLVVLAARSSLADHYIVPTGSMEYTVIPGDHVFVDKTAYGHRVPFTDWELSDGNPVERGDVIIFDSPENGIRLLKRVVAVAGDSVRLQGGELWIGGRSQRVAGDPGVERIGDHLAHLNLSYGGGIDLSEVQIPEGALLVVGDSRGNSRDGRFFGLIPEEIVYGKAEAVIYRKGEGLVWQRL